MVAIRMQFLLYLVLLLNVYNSFVSALYFHIGETEKKCLIEEIPDETMIIGNYRTQLYDKQKDEYLPATQGLGMFVEVKDPDEKVILSRKYGSEGRFTITSHTHGEHQICLHSNSSKFALFAGGMLRVHLDIQVGEHTNNYTEIAAKDKLTEMQLRVRQLMEQVDQIRKEQNYKRYCEEHFRQTNESTNQRILWWSIFQALILVAFGFLQMRHLNNWKKCNDIGDVHLPTEYYFGASAATEDLSDNADDPTGNFRSTPLTGWKVFPVFELCQSLWRGSLTKPPHHYRVAVISQVVGAVVFQKRQERNKRCY